MELNVVYMYIYIYIYVFFCVYIYIFKSYIVTIIDLRCVDDV